ncbi:hypothetical protein Tco_0184641 [Tanacetum coccineum]
MHNNIMAAGSRDRPPMLATGRYAQWRSRFLRYIDTRPNGDALRKCILKGPYTPTIVTTPAIPAIENSPAVPEQTTVETIMNMTPENRAHFESEKEAIHLILTGIGDEIYSTVDACQTAQEMWEAIERLQQGKGRESKWVKDSTYHKEKMLMCKQVEKGVQLQAEQSDWIADTDEEIDEQEIPKPSVLGKPTPFSDSLERTNFAKKKSYQNKCRPEGLSKPVTLQNLPQTATQAVRNTNVIKPGMYQITSSTTQTRAPQLTQTSRNTNPHVSTSTGVAHRTNVSRPQPRSNQMKYKVLPNTSQVKFKKTKVEDHPRISRISKQTKSETACNDSLNSRTSNVNAVCATCGKCVPISTRKPKSQANKSVATPHKKTVASESTTINSKSYYRMLYKKTSKAWKWWIAQQCPSAYTWVPKTKRKWVPKVRNESVAKKVSFAIVQLILFIVDSGCTKHMTDNLSLLCNFVEKYLGTVRFGNDQFAPILGYGRNG